MSTIKKEFTSYLKLPKRIYILFAARMVNSMGSFVLPFLTLFFTQKLSLSEDVAGTYFMISAVMALPGSMLGGKLSDQYGRKAGFVIFEGMAAVCLCLCAFIDKEWMICLLLILMNFFIAGAQPANNAMVADLTEGESRRTAFSMLYWGNNIGLAIGYSIAGFLFKNYTFILFLGNGIAAALSALLILLFMKDTKPDSNSMQEAVIPEMEKSEEGSLMKVILKRKSLIYFTLVSIMYSFVYSQFMFSLPIQLNEIFSSDSSAVYGVIMTVNALTIVCATFIVTKFTKKNKPILNIAIAGLFFGVGFGAIYFTRSYLLFYITAIIWSTGEILQSTNTVVYIAEHTPASHRGRVNAVIPMLSNAGYAIAPLLMGYFITGFGVRKVWILVFVLAIVASALMYYMYTKEKNNKTVA